MSSSETERLAREADQHRSQVDDTIDRLKDRFSVGQIVDELSGYVREGQGADMVRNLNRQVRDNPLALGLVGAGIAWLLVGQGVRDEGRRVKSRYDDWRDDDDLYDRDRISGGGFPVADGRPHTVGSGPYSPPPSSGSGSYAGGSSGSSGPGLGERAKGAASGFAGSASSAASSASNAASSAVSGISGAAHSAASGISGGARSAGDAISGAAGSVGDAASRGYHDARDAAYRGGSYVGDRASYYGRRARRSFLDTLQEEPLIVGAVALAIGAAVGAALPPTRREDELFGDTRDRLRDDAADYGRDALHRAEHVAGEAYRAGSDEADRKGLKPQGEGETMAEKVSSVAKSATDAAREDAKKEGLL